MVDYAERLSNLVRDLDASGHTTDIGGVAITGTPSAGNTIVAASGTAAAWGAGGGGAPTTVNYLVGTADAGLSAEIVVGTTPGGELGNTWASPTVDATHSGSSHAGTQTAAEATAAADATTKANAAAAASIAKTLLDAKGDLISATANDTPAIVTVGANDTILMADSAQAAGLKWVAAATPSTQALGDAAAEGSADTYARGDHVHGLPSQYTILPTGALAETYPRILQSQNAGVLNTARLHLVAINLRKGITVTSISFVSATTALSVGVNQWFALFNNALAKLAVTTDDTSTAWAASAIKTLNLSAPFVTTYAGLHYLGIMVKATTVPSLQFAALGTNTTMVGYVITPQICGAANTGLTDPASCPNPAAFSAGNGGTMYAYCS